MASFGAGMMAPGGFARRKKRCEDPLCELDHDVDAMMDPCCAKDLKDRRKAGVLLGKLRAADPTRKALDRRRGAFDPAPLPELEPDEYRETRRAAPADVDTGDDDDDGSTATDSEGSDDDDEYLDGLDDALLDGLRAAKLREAAEASPARLAAAIARGPVVVHCHADPQRAGEHLDAALADWGAAHSVEVLRTRRGAAVSDELLDGARISRDKVEGARGGALLAVVEGRVAACSLDLKEFADADGVALDHLERWLARAGVAVPSTVVDDHDDGDDPLEAPPEGTYYDCGKPGCCKPFEHHHVGLGQAPREWDVDRANAL